MRSRFLKALTDGGCAVVLSSNGGKPMHFFHWYEDGELRTTFEWHTARHGSTPDALNSAMREVGYTLSDDEDGTSETSERVDTKAAAFALAERLTGVRVTEELLQGAEYQLGYVPEEPPEKSRAGRAEAPWPVRPDPTPPGPTVHVIHETARRVRSVEQGVAPYRARRAVGQVQGEGAVGVTRPGCLPAPAGTGTCRRGPCRRVRSGTAGRHAAVPRTQPRCRGNAPRTAPGCPWRC